MLNCLTMALSKIWWLIFRLRVTFHAIVHSSPFQFALAFVVSLSILLLFMMFKRKFTTNYFKSYVQRTLVQLLLLAWSSRGSNEKLDLSFIEWLTHWLLMFIDDSFYCLFFFFLFVIHNNRLGLIILVWNWHEKK